MHRILIASILGLVLAGALAGCEALVVGSAATGTAVVHDRRTAGSFVEDENIELKAASALSKDQEIKDKAHISVTSFNQIVLLTGEAPTEAMRARAENIVAKIAKVRRVHNEVVIGAPSAMSARASDTWITGKVKTRLFKVKIKNFDPTRVKVVTENGTVFLMGLLTRAEADAVVDQVRQVGGVQRVVKVFEYIG
jgi:osmotically-inducible protein OsmY